MNLLNIIDQMGQAEYLIFMSAFLGLVNLGALCLLIKKQKKNKKLQESVEKIMTEALNPKVENKTATFKLNNSGVIDGGVIIALVGVAMIAFISGRETVSKDAVVNKEEIKIDNSVYQCREIRRKMLRYYDPNTGRYKYLPLKPNEGCYK